jgi:predicted RNase H-like HicB family nuclease
MGGNEKAVKYSVVLERSQDGIYTVTVSALSGCVTQGDNIAESLAHAKEVIDTHVEGLLILGKAVHEDVADVTLALRETQEILICKVPISV